MTDTDTDTVPSFFQRNDQSRSIPPNDMERSNSHAEALARHWRDLIASGVPHSLADELVKIAAHKLDGLVIGREIR